MDVLQCIAVSLLLVLLEPRIERGLAQGLQRWGQLHFTLRGAAYAGIVLACPLLLYYLAEFILPAGTRSVRMDMTAFGGEGQMIITFDRMVLGRAGAWGCAAAGAIQTT